MKDKRITVSEKVRKSVVVSTYTQAELSRLLEIQPSAISLFVNGKRGLTLETFDRLCLILNLEVVKRMN